MTVLTAQVDGGAVAGIAFNLKTVLAVLLVLVVLQTIKDVVATLAVAATTAAVVAGPVQRLLGDLRAAGQAVGALRQVVVASSVVQVMVVAQVFLLIAVAQSDAVGSISSACGVNVAHVRHHRVVTGFALLIRRLMAPRLQAARIKDAMNAPLASSTLFRALKTFTGARRKNLGLPAIVEERVNARIAKTVEAVAPACREGMSATLIHLHVPPPLRMMVVVIHALMR